MNNKFIRNTGKLLTMKENSIGVYFTDRAIYCSLQNELSSKAELIKHDINENIIKNGTISDKDALMLELKKAISKVSTKPSFVNITLPSSLTFSTLIHIPAKIADKKKLENAINLILNVELPWKKESAYIDYIINSDQNSTASVFAVKKEIIDSYISLFDSLDIKVILVEFDALSILRVMKIYNDTNISVTASKDNLSIIISNGDKIIFLYPLNTKGEPTKEAIEKEINKIKNYYSIETKTTINGNGRQLELKDEVLISLSDKLSDINFIPALGAGLRKEYFKGKDDNISFLDTKPNDLYRHHRLLSSLRLIRRSSIAVSLILISVHVLFFYIITNVAERNSVLSSQPPKIYASVLSIKNEVKQLNQITEMGSEIIRQMNRFSPKLQKIDSIFTEGVYPNSITISGPNSPISISGITATRTQYNYFRTSLSKMSEVQIVSFPLGNLNLQVNIPFGITITIID